MCSRCHRTFNNDSYYKHIKVCFKVFQMRRLPYNSRRKRLTREQLLFSITHRDKLSNEQQQQQCCDKEKTWKHQSEEFRRRIKELRERNQKEDHSSRKEIRNKQKHEKKKRYPFDSRIQRLKHLGDVKLQQDKCDKRQKRWKQLSQKFRAIVKLYKMLKN